MENSLFNKTLNKLSKIFGGIDYNEYTIDNITASTTGTSGIYNTSGTAGTAGTFSNWWYDTRSGTSGTSGYPIIKKDIRDRFEYKSSNLEDWDHNVDYLNTMGDDGWEIVYYKDISAFLTKIIWKRKIINPSINSGTCGQS